MSTKNTCSQTKTVKPQFLKFLSHIASIPFAYCKHSFRILQAFLSHIASAPFVYGKQSSMQTKGND